MTTATPSRLRLPRALVTLPLLAAAALMPGCSDRSLDPSAVGRRDPGTGYGSWRPALPEVPRAIAESDADLYRRIYAHQQREEWASADRLIVQLQDKSLLGHVLAARYFSGYQTRPGEIREWLSKYGDHPDASRIALLGSGGKAPARGKRRSRHADAGDHAGDEGAITTTSRKPRPQPDYRRRGYTSRGVGTVQGSYQLQLRRGNYEAAEGILNSGNAERALGATRVDTLKTELAIYYQIGRAHV